MTKQTNTKSITHLVTRPDLKHNHDKYKVFFQSEGFKFSDDCKFLTDTDAIKNHVYLIHDDKSCTLVEVA